MTRKESVNQFKLTKRRDKLKNKKIFKYKDEIEFFIRFNFKENLTKEYIIQKLKQQNVPVPTED
jgi:hypothetical protein